MQVDVTHVRHAELGLAYLLNLRQRGPLLSQHSADVFIGQRQQQLRLCTAQHAARSCAADCGNQALHACGGAG